MKFALFGMVLAAVGAVAAPADVDVSATQSIQSF